MEKTILFEEEILKALQSYPSNTPTAFYFILAIGYLLIAAGICFIAASVMFNRNEYWPFMAYIVTGVYIVLMGIEPPEAELKEIQIIKEAENSNDPVLKLKAANMKAEIAREEQTKLQSQIEVQEFAKNVGIERNTLV